MPGKFHNTPTLFHAVCHVKSLNILLLILVFFLSFSLNIKQGLFGVLRVIRLVYEVAAVDAGFMHSSAMLLRSQAN